MGGLRTETHRVMARHVKEGHLSETVDLRQERRPKTRGECKAGPRPCPWVSCRYHLGIAIAHNGSIKHTLKDGGGFQHTCALDVADAGGLDSEELVKLMGLTQEAVRLQMTTALRRFRDALLAQKYPAEYVSDAELLRSRRLFNAEERRPTQVRRKTSYNPTVRPRYIVAREFVRQLKLRKDVELWLTRKAPLWLAASP